MGRRMVATLAALTWLVGCSSMFLARKEMEPGERLFRGKCRSCHALPDPEAYSKAQWPAIVERYAERAKLTEADQMEIVRYLTKGDQVSRDEE